MIIQFNARGNVRLLSRSTLRRSTLHWLFISMVVLLFLTASVKAGTETAPSGLDRRPVNTSCIAPEPHRQAIAVTTTLPFPNIEFQEPIDLAQAPNDASQWYVASRGGVISRFANNKEVTTATVALDMQERIQSTGQADSQQWGITAFAFHPQFPARPYLYVAYNTNVRAESKIRAAVSRFETTDGGNTFDLNSELIIIEQSYRTEFHNIGDLAFGPDGYLYIAFGDDARPIGGQNLQDLLGAIIRIDVNDTPPYTIPPDNPLVGTGRGREELFAWGLRNPWRFNFDRETGDLWAGDVGAAQAEEVNLIQKGGNYGWNLLEGNVCRQPVCGPSDLISPVVAYSHDEGLGRAVIGGFVYRGQAIPELVGTYLFGDFAAESYQTIAYDREDNFAPKIVTVAQGVYRAYGFAEDHDGELYVLRSRNQQTPRKIIPATPAMPVQTQFPTLLSETGCISSENPREPATGLIPYSINHASWADGATQTRWMALPNDAQLRIRPDGDIEFPIGTVLLQTFEVDAIPVETRLSVRHQDGKWGGYSYQWLDDQSDAVLLPATAAKRLPNGQTWTYPSRAQCQQCHTEAADSVLGIELSQLNRDYLYPSTGRQANQLDTFEHIGLFENDLPVAPAAQPALAMIDDQTQPLSHRVRSYLHTNCAGCHRPEGPTESTMDLRFATAIEEMGICDSPPIYGDHGIENPALIRPGSPETSAVLQRLSFHDAYRMPPVGTRLIDTNAVDAITAWILSEGVCSPQAASRPTMTEPTTNQ